MGLLTRNFEVISYFIYDNFLDNYIDLIIFFTLIILGGGSRYFRGGRGNFWRGRWRGGRNSAVEDFSSVEDRVDDDNIEDDTDSQMSGSSNLSSSSLHTLLGGLNESVGTFRPSNNEHLAGPDHGILVSHFSLADLEYCTFLYFPSDFPESTNIAQQYSSVIC